MGGLAPRPGRFTPGKGTLYTLCRRLGWPQGRSGRVRKISPPPEFDARIVQPVASRYTDIEQQILSHDIWYELHAIVRHPDSEPFVSQLTNSMAQRQLVLIKFPTCYAV